MMQLCFVPCLCVLLMLYLRKQDDTDYKSDALMAHGDGCYSRLQFSCPG
jgi:hypothetical protein